MLNYWVCCDPRVQCSGNRKTFPGNLGPNPSGQETFLGAHGAGGCNHALRAGSRALLIYNTLLYTVLGDRGRLCLCWLHCVGLASRRKNDVAAIHSEDGLLRQTLANRRWLMIHEEIH